MNTMLYEALDTLNEHDKPVIHSDRGGHYRWPGWLDRINTSGLIRSMSRKGCSSDNAACEGFFGRIKNEMFYGRNWAGITLEKFICFPDRYIRWYNEKRIKLSGLAPIFPYTFYHLTHYWYAAADIPVANDIPAHYADAIRYNVRRPPQGSLPLLTRRAST